MVLLDASGNPLKDTWRDVDSWNGKVPEEPSLITLEDLNLHALGLEHEQLSLLGVRLNVEDDLQDISGYVAHLGLVELVFPKFKDGRFFSTAVKLRRDYHFRGELRASGDFIPDQALFLVRCGFSSLVIPPQFSVDQIAKSLNAYTLAYQTAEDRKLSIVQAQRAPEVPVE